jgi:S1-C subfamily serine protease
MKASCHRCGREYLTARAMAGKPVTCRSCGAQNDGAGGSPPPQEPAKSKGRSASPEKVHIASGAAFTVGGEPPREPRPFPAGARPSSRPDFESQGEAVRPGRNRGGAGTWLMFGGVVAAVLLLGVGVLWMAMRPSTDGATASPTGAAAPTGPVAWSTLQKAVPHIVGSGGTGSGFLIERAGRIWLVTNFHVIDGEERIEAIFWNPEDGAAMFRIPLDTRDFRVHPEFRQSLLDTDGQNDFDLAVCDVTSQRHNLAGNGIAPMRLAEQKSDRQGERVRALGHPGTTVFAGDEVDDRARGTQRHAIVDGVLTKVFRERPPQYWRTDAPLAPGFSGGPLVLDTTQEVLAINTFFELENGAKKAGADFCLAAHHAIEAIDRGVPLSEVRVQLAQAVRGAEGRQEDFDNEKIQRWPTFPTVANIHKWYTEQGFTVGAVFVTTDNEGSHEYQFQVPGPGPRIVAFAVMPEDPLVQVQIFPFLDSNRRDLGPAFTSNAAEPAFVRPVDPLSGEILPIEAGITLLPTIGTRFCGQPIPARCVILVCHKQVEGGGGGVAQPPQASPSSPPGSSGATPGRGGIAATAEVTSGMASDVYASSVVGLRRFDEDFLHSVSQDECFERLSNVMADRSSGPQFKDDPDFFRDIMLASLVRSIYIDELWAKRPLFEVHVKAPESIRLGVYLEVDPTYRRYLPLPPGGLVSARADAALVESDPPAGIRYDPEMGAYRIALSLPWNAQELATLTQAIDVPYSIRVEYGDGSSDLLSGQMRVLPITQVEFLYPWGLGFAAMVNESHPWVRRIIDDINQQKLVKDAGFSVAGAGGDAEDKLMSIFLVWRELASRGIRYQNLTAAEGSAQRCRLIHETLSAANANCLDGTVLLASFLEAIGMDTYLVLVPDHALLAAWIEGELFFFETVRLGATLTAEERALDHPSELFRSLRSKHRLLAGNEFEAFEYACIAGRAASDSAVEGARPVLDKYREMQGAYQQRSSDPAWLEAFAATIEQLGGQIMFIPVSFARTLGVRPVAHPSDLDTRFKLPPRR